MYVYIQICPYRFAHLHMLKINRGKVVVIDIILAPDPSAPCPYQPHAPISPIRTLAGPYPRDPRS